MIVSGRTIATETIDEIRHSLDMTEDTKKKLDEISGWAKDFKVYIYYFDINLHRRRQTSAIESNQINQLLYTLEFQNTSLCVIHDCIFYISEYNIM